MSGAKKKMERRALQQEMGLTEKQKQELKTQAAKRRNTILAIAVGVVAVVLVVALLVWHSGFIPRHTTALTVKDHKLSVADMDYYYHQFLNNYAYTVNLYAQNGLTYDPNFDPSVDMKDQYRDEEQTQTYYDYFMEQAKDSAVEVCALYDAAVAAGHTLSEDAQAQLDSSLADLDATVSQYHFGSRSAYLKAVYGRNMTEGVYMDNMKMNVMATDYYNTLTSQAAQYSDEELTAYYNENPGLLDSYDYDYAYLDGTVLPSFDDDGNAVEVTDEDRAATLADAKAKAESLLAAVKAAQAETPAEGESAKTFSDVSAEEGATATVRTGVMGYSFSTLPYADWLMDSARKDGDVDLFEIENAGYYVVEFHNRYLDDEPTVDVRHILLSTAMEDDPATEDVDESKLAPTEERVAEVKAEAQVILDEFLAGEQSPAVFGQLAEEHSADGRDANGDLNAAGGLYTGINKETSFVQPFKDWCLDPSRQAGDTGLVQTDYGWHIMYFQGLNRPTWMEAASDYKQSEDQIGLLDELKAGYEAVEGSGWSQVGLS